MSEELNLVRDLAVILIAAGVFTIISRALKQPLVLGYILAGILIGPHIDFFPGISSQQAVSEWSEIGVIFLMFTLGLEFSFKKLLKVGTSALVVAGCKFIGVFVIGFLVGMALGWDTMESVFLAGLLSMSSTAVVIKAYDDLGLKQKPYASLVFGTLVIEDLIAILLMVLLSTMAVSRQFSGPEMLFNLAKLVFFLVLWFLVGIYLIPTVLKKARAYLNDEILLVVSIGLCFGMVSLATAVGFSSALGAFVMGSILAETVESEHISRLVTGIKDLFSAIFFVSVGMMVDPAVIAQNWAVILLLTVIVILTHILFTAGGGMLSGRGVDNSVHAGFSLAQLGEFGFIIAGVGTSLGVMRGFIYPIIVTVSVITTFTTPYMIKLSDGAAALTQRKMPARWLDWIRRSEEASQPRSNAERSEWKLYIRQYLLRIGLYTVVIIAIMIGSRLYLDPLLAKWFSHWSELGINLASAGITLLVMAPFLYGIAVGRNNTESAHKLIREKESNRLPLLALIFLQIFIAISFVLVLLASHFHLAGWTVLVIVVAILLFTVFARRSATRFSAIERRFIENLNARETRAKELAPVATSFRDKLAGYDVHIEKVKLSPDSAFVGKPLKDLPFRLQTGVNIVKILRGTRTITIPSGDELLYPDDVILAAGTGDQIRAFRTLVAESVQAQPKDTELFDVVPVQLDETSYLCGKTLHSLRMRDYRVMVISVLRNGEFLTNPASDFKFMAGDTVWLAGERSSIDWFNESGRQPTIQK